MKLRVFLYSGTILYLSILPAHAMQSLRILANRFRSSASSNLNPLSLSLQKINLYWSNRIKNSFSPELSNKILALKVLPTKKDSTALKPKQVKYEHKNGSRENAQSNWPWQSLAMSTLIYADEENPGLDNRPPEIQAAIDQAFKYNINVCQKTWLYNGSSYYGLLDLDEDKMLHNLAFENLNKKDVYIIDVGCSRGNWGNHAMNILLEDEACKKSGKSFHIFSLTGGKECEEIILQEKHVTLYQFNQFKIENIDEELSKRGFNLKDNVDIIVSRWTLRHLVDPFGTLKRMYGLLTPAQGKLMSNGFLFMFNDSDEIQAFPYIYNANILSTNNSILFKDDTAGRDVGHFLLMRSNKNELRIPLTYTNKIGSTSWGHQNASGRVTIYKKKPCFNSSFDLERVEKKRDLYCDKSDQQCKDLYLYLKRQKLFYRDE